MPVLKHLRWVETIDCRNRTDCYDIRPGDQGGNSRESLLFDPLVHLQFFVDIQVTVGEIGFWLVIVVVTHKILHCIFGE